VVFAGLSRCMDDVWEMYGMYKLPLKLVKTKGFSYIKCIGSV